VGAVADRTEQIRSHWSYAYSSWVIRSMLKYIATGSHGWMCQ